MAERIVGIHTVGRFSSPPDTQWRNLPLTVSVPFPTAFARAPVVTVTTLQDPNYPGAINDTFATTVVKVTKTDFTLHIVRVDTVKPNYSAIGWDQNLQLAYTAEVPA
jgi:hypothetical protein